MPALANRRHERFAQGLHKYGNSRRAYSEAGYKAKKGLTPRHSGPLDRCATRLSKNVQVQERLQELRAMALKRHEITVDSLLNDLEVDRKLAHESGQSGAAVSATMAKAKLLGLIVERTERGAPGEFQNLQSVQEVIAAVRRDLGDDAADALAQLVDGSSEPPVATHTAPPGKQ